MFKSFYEILVVLIKNRKIIIWTTFGFTVFALVLSLVIPPKYRATATLMPPVSQGTSVASLMMRGGGLISDPEIGGTGMLPGMITPSDVFAYMLTSGTISGMVINECALIKHYKEDGVFSKTPEKAMETVGKKLKKATKIKVNEQRFILISVEDKNRIKAAEIANCYASALDRVYAKLTMTQGGNMREFIEKRMVSEELFLKQLEDSLKDFQKQYRTVSLNDEMRAVIEMSATLEAKIISQRIEMEAMKSYGTVENPQIMSLDNQISKAEQQLNELMKGSKNKNLFVPFARAPDIGMELGRRMRDVKIHQEVYGLLVQQLEQAKIMEAKDTPKIQFLERATPPYRKSWPKRSIITLLGLFTGLLISVMYVFYCEYLNIIRSNSLYSEKVSDLKGLFKQQY